jgi:hypothetical protein
VPSLDDVTQRFIADTAPYIAALKEAADAAREFAAANAEAMAAAGATAPEIKLLAEAVNSLEQSEMYASDASETLNLMLREVRDSSADLMMQTALLSEGFAGLNTRLDSLIAHAAATRAALHDLGTAMLGLAMETAVANAAAATSGVAAGIAAGFWRRWGTVIHWVIAGGAEFLAVFIPAVVAAGSAALVMAEGVTNATTRMQAMYTVQEATANMLHQTVGNWLGMKSVLQQAQTAADPRVYELLGAGINIAKSAAGGFVTEGIQVLNVLDNFAAKITGEMQGALGGQLHTLLAGGAKDLQELFAILGNVGHAFLNLASAMPGLAHVLLDVFAAASKILEVLTTMPGIIITVAMAFEEFWRWGGLAATIIANLLRWVAGIVPLFGAAAVAVMNTARALVVATVEGFAGMIAAVGRGLVIMGTWIAEMGLATIAEGGMAASTVTLGVGISGLGARIVAFAAEIRAALAEMGPFMATLALAGAVLLAFAIDKLATAKTATQQFTDALQHAVDAANNLNKLNTIADNFQKLAKAEADVSSGAFLATAAMKGTYDAGLKYGSAMQAAASASQTLSAAEKQQRQDLNNTLQAIGFLEKTYGTTFVGAMVLANQAGLNLAAGINNQGNAANMNRLKIANYMASMMAMGQSATVAGHDVTMLGIASQLSATKVGQLNQAIDQFIQNATGGTSAMGGLVESIANIGKVTVTSGNALKGYNATAGLTLPQIQKALTNFGQVGSQVWQNFDSALTGSASQLADWFRTAGAEGAIGSQRFSQAMMDITAQFIPFAKNSKIAQNELVAFANAQGLNITSFGQLVQKAGNVQGDMKQLAGIIGLTTKQMSDMNQIAQALGASVGTDVVNAMNQAKLAASGLGSAAQGLANSWFHAHTVNSAVVSGFQQTFVALARVYGNTATAKAAADAYARSLGMTQAQVNALNRTLAALQAEINRMHGKTIQINVNTLYTQSGNRPSNQSLPGGYPGGVGAQHGMMVGFAGGGMVGGGGGVDMMHAMLTAGEAVLTAQAVSALGGPLAIHSLNNQPSQGVLTAGAGGGGGQALSLRLRVDSYLNSSRVSSEYRTTTLIYNRRNPANNLDLRVR